MKTFLINPKPPILFWINHRLRQPLCSASGLVQILKDDPDLPDHLQETLHLLAQQLTSMDQLTRQAVTEIVSQISHDVQRQAGIIRQA